MNYHHTFLRSVSDVNTNHNQFFIGWTDQDKCAHLSRRHRLIDPKLEKAQKATEERRFLPYKLMNILGRGTYGTVYESKDEYGRPIALKIVRFCEETNGIPSTVLREVSLLKELLHENIIQLMGLNISSDSLVLIFELALCDLRYFQNIMQEPLTMRRTKSLMYQLLSAVAYVHSFKILHRDLKPQNLLLMEDGTLKVADFGLARAFTIPVREFVHEVVTLWYRPPDVLLGNQNYSTDVDMWSVGCIFAEMLNFSPLFCGKSVKDHIAQIFQVLGTPSLEDLPHYDKFVDAEPINKLPYYPKQDLSQKVPFACADAIDLLKQLLVYDGEKRLSAAAALEHPYFTRTPFARKIPLNIPLMEHRKRSLQRRAQMKKLERGDSEIRKP